MKIMKIWKKWLTKTNKIIVDTKRFIVTLKSFQKLKIKIIVLTKSTQFFNFFWRDFFSSLPKWFLTFNNQSSCTICFAKTDLSSASNSKYFSTYSSSKTSLKFDLVTSSWFLHASKNFLLGLSIYGSFSTSNPSGMVWYDLRTSKSTTWLYGEKIYNYFKIIFW